MAQLADNPAVAAPTGTDARPMLLFFMSPYHGPSRRAAERLAQVLQRRGNHNTFRLRYIDVAERPDLVARFRIEATPTILVVEENRIRARLHRPTTAPEIRASLRPWLK